MPAYIVSSGSYVPSRVVSNLDLEPLLGLTADQIFRSCGIKERRWAAEDESASSMGTNALAAAIGQSGLSPAEIDLLIVGTMSPDYSVPGTAPIIQAKLGLSSIPTLDIRCACCNFLYGIQVAAAMIESRRANLVALVFPELQSRFLDRSPQAANLSMLFGDGASAVLVSSVPSGPALEISDVVLFSDGSHATDLGVAYPGSAGAWGKDTSDAKTYPRMSGQQVILSASRGLVEASRKLLERNSLTVADVNWVVPHQANSNLLSQFARTMGIDPSKTILTIQEFGNTSSASIGLTLDVLAKSGNISRNDRILIPAFAAGFTWGAGLLRAGAA